MARRRHSCGDFNPRTPCGVRPSAFRSAVRVGPGFQSTHPVWGATVPSGQGAFYLEISIHAPRVGCDYIRVSKTGGGALFQSTHPVWGATSEAIRASRATTDFNPRTPCGVRHILGRNRLGRKNFNPRTPCGVRPLWTGCPLRWRNFNPRTPCGVRRVSLLVQIGGYPGFQSTHPVWGATIILPQDYQPYFLISIHAPRVGCDRQQLRGYQPLRISIHAPRVGCDAGWHAGDVVAAGISIHAPRVGCDKFYPYLKVFNGISIHAPRVGCDMERNIRDIIKDISIHAPRVGCDAPVQPHILPAPVFQSTHPVWGATLPSTA